MYKHWFPARWDCLNQLLRLRLTSPSRGVHLPLSQWCILYIPPYFHKIYKCPLVSFNLRFLLNLCFLLPPILTRLHLCIMLYTYWTPLSSSQYKWSTIRVGNKTQNKTEIMEKSMKLISWISSANLITKYLIDVLVIHLLRLPVHLSARLIKDLKHKFRQNKPDCLNMILNSSLYKYCSAVRKQPNTPPNRNTM